MELILLPLLLLGGLLATLGGNDDDDGSGGDPDPDDTLAGSGTERIFGGEGDDLLTLDDQAQGLGGVGDDTIYAQDDALGYGLEGNDTLTGDGNATIKGGDGDDVLTIHDRAVADGGAGDDVIYASDIFYGGLNVTGGEGRDMFVADLRDTADGNTLGIADYAQGVDRLGVMLGDMDLTGVQVMISESDDPEGFVGTTVQVAGLSDAGNAFATFFLSGVFDFDASDVMFYRNEVGDAPDWQPVTGGENDVLMADGTATVNGGAGDDLVVAHDQAVGRGGIGDDLLIATGEATAEGGTGNDVLAGVVRFDTETQGILLRGEEGDDRLNGGDTQYGGAGNDVLGNAGLMIGGEGDDIFRAGGAVYGGSGDDQVFRSGGGPVDLGAGDDLLQVTTGSAPGNFGTLAATLGEGADRLVFDPSYHDVIAAQVSDFDPSEDVLGVIGSASELQNLTLTRSYDAQNDTTRLVLNTGLDDIGSEIFVNVAGQDAMTAAITVQLYADAAAVQAGTPYRTL